MVAYMWTPVQGSTVTVSVDVYVMVDVFEVPHVSDLVASTDTSAVPLAKFGTPAVTDTFAPTINDNPPV
jgi:hypothetical protein